MDFPARLRLESFPSFSLFADDDWLVEVRDVFCPMDDLAAPAGAVVCFSWGVGREALLLMLLLGLLAYNAASVESSTGRGRGLAAVDMRPIATRAV